jgi:polyphosphate kinase 2
MTKNMKRPDLFDQAAVELVKLQKHVIATEKKLLIIVEGRDGAGKDGLIKRVTKHMNPRETRIVALGKPSDRDRKAWYFERWVAHLPVGGEIVFFNRSWYNRAGVERVMGFCTEADYNELLLTAPLFEQLLAHCGITILKYYLDISKGEQKRRLAERHDDPLKQWKLSAVDDKAIKKLEGVQRRAQRDVCPHPRCIRAVDRRARRRQERRSAQLDARPRRPDGLRRKAARQPSAQPTWCSCMTQARYRPD